MGPHEIGEMIFGAIDQEAHKEHHTKGIIYNNTDKVLVRNYHAPEGDCYFMLWPDAKIKPHSATGFYLVPNSGIFDFSTGVNMWYYLEESNSPAFYIQILVHARSVRNNEFQCHSKNPHIKIDDHGTRWKLMPSAVDAEYTVTWV